MRRSRLGFRQFKNLHNSRAICATEIAILEPKKESQYVSESDAPEHTLENHVLFLGLDSAGLCRILVSICRFGLATSVTNQSLPYESESRQWYPICSCCDPVRINKFADQHVLVSELLRLQQRPLGLDSTPRCSSLDRSSSLDFPVLPSSIRSGIRHQSPSALDRGIHVMYLSPRYIKIVNIL
jgi:hypothetical protein